MTRYNKIESEIEPFSMAPRVAMDGVQLREEDGCIVPAIKVKVRPLHPHIPGDLLARANDKDIEAAYESVVASWWENVPAELAATCFKSAFKGEEYETRAAGRSNGWLVVFGIGNPAHWNKRKLAAWIRFEKLIKKSMVDAEKAFHEEIRERLDGR